MCVLFTFIWLLIVLLRTGVPKWLVAWGTCVTLGSVREWAMHDLSGLPWVCSVLRKSLSDALTLCCLFSHFVSLKLPCLSSGPEGFLPFPKKVAGFPSPKCLPFPLFMMSQHLLQSQGWSRTGLCDPRSLMAVPIPCMLSMVQPSYSPAWPFLQPLRAYCRPFSGHTCPCSECQQTVPPPMAPLWSWWNSDAKNNGHLAFSLRAQPWCSVVDGTQVFWVLYFGLLRNIACWFWCQLWHLSVSWPFLSSVVL